MSVKFTRSELSIMLQLYQVISDCIAGEPAIKGWISTGPNVAINGSNVSNNAGAFNGGGDLFGATNIRRAKRYLPMPNAHNNSPANQDRYRAYVQRAMFYNVTGRTLDGMVGQIFLIDPVVKVPAQLKPMLTDIDGKGLTLVQGSKRSSRDTLSFGRAGLFTDYPQTGGNVTAKDIASGKVKPTITHVKPWDIINWDSDVIDGKSVLTLLVFRDTCDDLSADGFSIEISEQYKVLRLVNGVYTIETHTCDNDAAKSKQVYKQDGATITPTNFEGKTFDYIPFTFIGAENNDESVDKPPLYDLASLNIGHYRNSADYEEACFMVGQPTPWIAGLDDNWYKEVLKGSIPLGSREGIPLPVGATIGLLQANANTMPKEAMLQKEDEMVALGAKLVIQKRIQRTATEAVVDASSESSVLANVAVNVSHAYTIALQFACDFVGGDKTAVSVKLNTQFELNRLTTDDITKIVSQWQLGALTYPEMRDAIRKTGLAYMTDDEAKAETKQERKDGLIPPAVLDVGLTAGTPTAPNPNNDPVGHAATARKAAVA